MVMGNNDLSGGPAQFPPPALRITRIGSANGQVQVMFGVKEATTAPSTRNTARPALVVTEQACQFDSDPAALPRSAFWVHRPARPSAYAECSRRCSTFGSLPRISAMSTSPLAGNGRPLAPVSQNVCHDPFRGANLIRAVYVPGAKVRRSYVSTRPPTSGHTVEDDATSRRRRTPFATLTFAGSLQSHGTTRHVPRLSVLKSSRHAVVVCTAADDGIVVTTSKHAAAQTTVSTL